MKQIYKILISVFIISILALASTQATAKTTYIPPPYSAIYSDNPGSSFIKLPTDCESNPRTCPDMVSYTFYLPTSAYVYIDVSGQLYNIYNAAAVMLKIDNVDSMTRSRSFTNTAAGLNTCLETGVQISTTNLLTSGYHTIYLSGYQINGSINHGMTALGQISITVVANQNGNIVNG